MSQAPQNALLESRLHTRNLRTLRLAPIAGKPSQLPPLPAGMPGPVTIANDSGTLNRSYLRTSARGVRLHRDPIRY